MQACLALGEWYSIPARGTSTNPAEAVVALEVVLNWVTVASILEVDLCSQNPAPSSAMNPVSG